MKKLVLLIFLFLNLIISCKEEDLHSDYVVNFSVEVDTSNPNNSNSNTRIEIDEGVLMLPENYFESDEKTKLIIYCHSGGGTVTRSNSEAQNSNYCKYLVSLGYAVLDVAGMPKTYSSRLKIDHNRTLGSFVAVRSYLAGLEYVFNHYNLDVEGIFLLANSNGGLVANNLVNLSDISIQAQVGIAPLISIEHNAWNSKSKTLSGGGFEALQNRANIIRIYGMTNVTTQEELNNALYEKEKVGQYDPFDYFMNLSQEKYKVPFKIFQAINDGVVSHEIANNFMVEANKRNSDVTLITYEEGGHRSELSTQNVGEFMYDGQNYKLNKTIFDAAKWFEAYGGLPVLD